MYGPDDMVAVHLSSRLGSLSIGGMGKDRYTTRLFCETVGCERWVPL